ncbi:hypothetical protein [uncultured Methylibium sp.]|uniref:hypothetical protein n=1 Tax=uncultured Methylibium sp. TaxID=381093 RepID=UPI0025D1ECE3|nr:hypothetical protein [uncultured Methylibium sp.]
MHTARTLAALALLTLAGTGIAQATPYRAAAPDRHEWQQDQRIRQGLASGALTRHEARVLNQRQDRIDALERRFRADGRYTPQERRQVAQLERDLDRDITRELRDRQTAWHR